MKRVMLLFAGILMAAALSACTPTQNVPGSSTEQAQGNNHAQSAPAGAMMESTVDGVLEKQRPVEDAEPSVTVCVYSVNKDGNGLKQNMDALDGEELDAQLLMDKMAELGVVEEGIEVLRFEEKDSVLTMDLSSLEGLSDEMILTAIANTFIQNYEARELNLSVAGGNVGDGAMTFLKEYKKMK